MKTLPLLTIAFLGLISTFPGSCDAIFFEELDIDCCEVACYVSQGLCDYFCAAEGQEDEDEEESYDEEEDYEEEDYEDDFEDDYEDTSKVDPIDDEEGIMEFKKYLNNSIVCLSVSFFQRTFTTIFREEKPGGNSPYQKQPNTKRLSKAIQRR